jgi:TolB protein
MTYALAFGAALLVAGDASSQWTNRYPKVAGYSHHVYLEGYELPVLNAGPSDPAPSPDGRTIALERPGPARLLSLESGVARRLTRGRDLDFRPRRSPDGRRIVFVTKASAVETVTPMLDGDGTWRVLGYYVR